MASLENFAYLLREVSYQLLEIYSEEGQEFMISILKPIFTDYSMRLCRMEDNSTPKVKLEEYLERITLSGQLSTIVEEYKQQTEQITGQELKNAKKWINDRVKDAIRASHRFVTDKMPNHGVSGSLRFSKFSFFRAKCTKRSRTCLNQHSLHLKTS